MIKCIYNGKDVFLWLPTGFNLGSYETAVSTTNTVTVELAVVVVYT